MISERIVDAILSHPDYNKSLKKDRETLIIVVQNILCSVITPEVATQTGLAGERGVNPGCGSPEKGRRKTR